MATTDDGRWDTETRTSLLTARGYPDDVIAGNGNGVEASPTPPRDEASPLRTCRGCAMPLSGAPSKRWCSNACRKRHEKAQVGPRYEDSGQVLLAPQTPAQEEAVSTPPPGLGNFVAQLMALADELPAGVSVEIATGKACFRW